MASQKPRAMDRLSQRMTARLQHLSPASQRVVMHIDAHRLDAMTQSAAELAAAIGTSDATVIRAVKALGFAGLPELKQELISLFGKGATPADDMSRTLTGEAFGAEQAVSFVLSWHHDAAASIRSRAVTDQILKAVDILSKASKIATFGLGPSSHLSNYAAALLQRHGRTTHALNCSGSGLADQLLRLEHGDALLMLAYGRAYVEAAVTMARARRLGIPIVLMTDSLESKLQKLATVVVAVPRGQSERISLHGATMVCIEAMLLGIAASDRERTMARLDLLNELRSQIGRNGRPRVVKPRRMST